MAKRRANKAFYTLPKIKSTEDIQLAIHISRKNIQVENIKTYKLNCLNLADQKLA